MIQDFHIGGAVLCMSEACIYDKIVHLSFTSCTSILLILRFCVVQRKCSSLLKTGFANGVEM